MTEWMKETGKGWDGYAFIKYTRETKDRSYHLSEKFRKEFVGLSQNEALKKLLNTEVKRNIFSIEITRSTKRCIEIDVNEGQMCLDFDKHIQRVI